MLLAAFAFAPLAASAQGDTCTVTLPWSENFDSYTTVNGTSMPDCWTRVTAFQVNPGSNAALRPNLTTASNHGNVLNFMGQASSSQGTGTMRIATPLIPAPLNAIEISFQAYKYGLTVYLATDYSNTSTYTLVGSYNPGYVWTTYEIRTDTLTGAPAAQGYIVFASTYGASGYSTANLDNLSVVSLNTCPRPEWVQVDQVGTNSAVLSWAEVDDAQNYRVLYDTVDDPTYADYVTATGSSVTLGSLLPDHHYYVWVQSVCAPGTYSDNRGVDFTTQMNCYPPVNLRQASTGFDAAAFAWEYDDRGNSSTGMWTVLRDLDDPTATIEAQSTGDVSHIVTNLDPTHSYEIDFYNICGSDTAAVATLPIAFKVCGESALAILPHNYDMHPVPVGYNYGYSQMLYPADVFLDMDTIRGIALHRYLLGSSANSVTRTLSIWMQNTADTLHNSAVSTTGMTQVANNVSYTLPVQDWDTILFTTPFVYTPGSNVLLTIDDNTGSHVSTGTAQWMWHEQDWKTLYKNSDDSNPDPAAISGLTTSARCPDMHFVGICHTDLSCVAPVVVVVSVDSVSADISWMGSGIGRFSVEYRTSGADTWTLLDSSATAPFTIGNLQASMHYEVRVGLLCEGADDWRYSDIVNFTTGCALMEIPFHFTQTDMAAAADNGFTNCWTFSQYTYRGRLTNSHRGYVRTVGNGEWLMLPAISGGLEDARLRMWVESSDQGYVKVGVASMPNASDVVWIDTVEIPAGDPNTSHHEYVTYLDRYTGTGNRIVLSAIANNDYHSIYFLDFHVEPIEGCRPVEDVVLDSSTATSLSVSWTPMGVATQWAVYVNGARRTVVSGQPSCTLTGLSPYTMYEVSVRSLCDDDDSSSVASENFRTACSGEQCSFTIEAHASEGEGWKGAHLKIYAAGEQIEDFTMRQGSDLSRSYSVCANSEVVFRWFSGSADNECSFALRNAAGDTIYYLIEGPGHGDTLYVSEDMCSDAPACVDRYSNTTQVVCDSYQWRGRTLTASGNYIDTVAGAVEGGCDSIYILALTLNHSVSTAIDTSAQESLVWHGVTYTESGDYSWTGTAANGCDSVVTIHLTIGSSQGIETVEDELSVSLFPNPTSGLVRIMAAEIESIEVYDAAGRMLFVVRGKDTVDLSQAAAGTYTLRVVMPEGIAVRKVMKY